MNGCLIAAVAFGFRGSYGTWLESHVFVFSFASQSFALLSSELTSCYATFTFLNYPASFASHAIRFAFLRSSGKPVVWSDYSSAPDLSKLGKSPSFAPLVTALSRLLALQSSSSAYKPIPCVD